MSDLELIQTLQKQCIDGAEGDLSLTRQAIAVLLERGLDALVVLEGVCRRQKVTLNAVGFGHCAAFVDKLLAAILVVKKRQQDTPAAREDLTRLSAALAQAFEALASYYQSLREKGADEAAFADSRAALADAIASWTPTAAAPAPPAKPVWVSDAGARLALFSQSVARLPQHPVESIQVVIGITRALHEVAQANGAPHLAGYLEKVQSALMMVKTRVSNHLGTPEDLELLQVALEDVHRDCASYLGEIEEFGGDAAERAASRTDTAIALAAWRQSETPAASSTAASGAAVPAASALAPETGMAESKQEFPLLKSAVSNFLTNPLESVRAIQGVCRRLEDITRRAGFQASADHIQRLGLALSRLETTLQGQPPSPADRELLHVHVDDAVRGVLATFHEIQERGWVDLPESAEMRREQVDALQNWAPSTLSPAVDEAPRALSFTEHARTELAQFHEALESLPHHPAESLSELLGVCDRLLAGFQADGCPHAIAHVGAARAALEKVAQVVAEQPPSGRALATLVILLEDTYRGFESYVQDLRAKGADDPELAASRADAVAALARWAEFEYVDLSAARRAEDPAPPAAQRESEEPSVLRWTSDASSHDDELPWEPPPHTPIEPEPEFTERPPLRVSPPPTEFEPREAVDEPAGGRFLIFETRGKLYALAVERVREVVTSQLVYPLPFERPDIAGLMNLRGEPLPILALEPAPAGGARYVVVASFRGTRCGFEAERIWRVTALDARRFQRAENGWVSQRTEADGKAVWIVEPERAAG